MMDYVGSEDLVEAIDAAMEYHPETGFDRFLVNADDQYCTLPSLEFAERYCPGVPVDAEKLSRCGGFGAFIDCSRAKEALGWQPRYSCREQR
jgi:nucleoside-diphosphate-sugar epimerase